MEGKLAWTEAVTAGSRGGAESWQRYLEEGLMWPGDRLEVRREGMVKIQVLENMAEYSPKRHASL